MPPDQQFSEALEYHARDRPGKTEVRPTKPTATQQDLSLAYTPGVAEPSLAIHRDPSAAFSFTNRGNLVAVVSNGTAVLGLGNIGPLAAKPVMEGKAVLFKRFADIDAFDIEVATEDPDELIRFCELLAPTVGGINLEDVRAPECFRIETELRQRLDIPVFHDDQHGTAIIAGAAFLNGLALTDRRVEDAAVVVSGAGAAGTACARFFRDLGVPAGQITMCDSSGVVHAGRDDLAPHKQEFAHDTAARSLEDALEGADVLVGVSVAGTVTGEMLERMAGRPLVFALANPDPEIPYDDAKAARPDALVATGRTDYPNQVNNVLGFPFIFRGALDVQARHVTDWMKVAAAQALAGLAREPVPESVLKAYRLSHLSFGPDYLIPKPFDPRVLWWVAPAVAEAAAAEGAARRPLDDLDAYRERLRGRSQPSYGLITMVHAKARRHPMSVVYPHGADIRIIRAARRVVDEQVARPVILGRAGPVRALAAEREIALDGVSVLDPEEQDTLRERYVAELVALRSRKGITRDDAERAILDPNLFAAMMVRDGDADAVLGGLTTYYPDTLRPALQVMPLERGRSIVSAVYIVVVGGRSYFLADCAVNIDPTAEQLAEIALATAGVAEEFDVSPRVAFVSYSNFGSAGGEEPERVRSAVRICTAEAPDMPLDGEMHADTAVMPDLLQRRHPFNRLGLAANVLVFPNLTAANAAYKLLHRLGGAEIMGPILTGLSRSVHVLQRDAEVGDIVNLTAIAVRDAQRKAAGA